MRHFVAKGRQFRALLNTSFTYNQNRNQVTFSQSDASLCCVFTESEQNITFHILIFKKYWHLNNNNI